MKTTLIVLLFAISAAACKTGDIEHEGVCAADPQPLVGKVPDGVMPSDEKPSRHPQPAWERGEVVADMRPSEAANDAKLDAEKEQAELDGKRAAGIK